MADGGCQVAGGKKGAGGSAMIEFTVALVAVLALAAGLLQVASLAKAQNEALAEARRRAGAAAMRAYRRLDTPDYIRHWKPGPDERPYTRDDVHTRASGGAFRKTIVGKAGADPLQWSILDGLPRNEVAALHGHAQPVKQLGLVGETETRPVPLLPAVRHLIYGAEYIDVTCEAWCTWTTGIY